MVLGGLLVSLAENKKAEIGDNETSLSHIGEADIGEADHQTDHDPDQRNNPAGNLGALAPAGIAVLVSWLGRPLGRLGARCAFGPVAGVIRRQRDRTGFLPRLNVGGAVGILGMVQSIAVLRGKNHSAVVTALVGQMAAADGATHKTALLFSSGITQKTTIALSLLYNPGKAKGKGLRSVLRQFMRFCCAKHA